MIIYIYKNKSYFQLKTKRYIKIIISTVFHMKRMANVDTNTLF